MATISYVGLEIQKGIDPSIPPEFRAVQVSYGVQFTPEEQDAGTILTETISLYGADGGTVNEGKRLAVFSGRSIAADGPGRTEAFTGYVRRAQLDEDKEPLPPGQAIVPADTDEIVARVCLATDGGKTCADSRIVTGSWGAGGRD